MYSVHTQYNHTLRLVYLRFPNKTSTKKKGEKKEKKKKTKIFCHQQIPVLASTEQAHHLIRLYTILCAHIYPTSVKYDKCIKSSLLPYTSICIRQQITSSLKHLSAANSDGLSEKIKYR
uniref:Uncharacterized protein n=1 Tax=Daphnia magna TaxID=35525 RepID=A0A0N8DSB2_9CRUS